MSDKEEQDGPKLDKNKSPISTRRAKKLMVLSEYLSKQESRNRSIKVSRILKKAETDLTAEEKETLGENQDIVKRIHKNKERRKLSEQRTQEKEDTEDELRRKCEELAIALQEAKRTVIYTGAGISTAASIPDYRGPQGVWTLLQRGEELKPQDLSDAEPTVTHMCITELEKQGYVTHVVSQNCDGLHLRSGFPRKALSEVHGNMFLEMCYNCKPHREYIRLFDVTENTGVRRHQTGRQCHQCKAQLKDTIVHFGEKGRLKSPYRWREAARAANKCDLILCLGSSLKILKKYACLWCMDRTRYKRPKMIIVNLQWTPKDDAACLKINGRCDDVMIRVMKSLGLTPPFYNRESDPIFKMACPLSEFEQSSTVKKRLIVPDTVMQSQTDNNSVPQGNCISDTESESESDSDDSEGSSEEGSSETDSDYSDSEAGEEESEIKVENTNVHNNIKVEEVKKDVKVNKQPLDPDEEQKLMLKKKCLEKSKQICKEAVLTYQKRLNENPHFAQFGDEQLLRYAQSQTSPLENKSNNLSQTDQNPHTSQQKQEYSNYIVVQNQTYQNNHMPSQVSKDEHSYSKHQQQKISNEQEKFESQFFDGSYEDRLMKLHMLKAQLQMLKDKQKGLTHPTDQNQGSLHQQYSTLVGSTSTWPRQVSTQHCRLPNSGQANLHPANSSAQQQIARLELTRKQNEETQLLQFQERIQREQLELKRQHGNELLRLSQHHIMQQQLIDQNGMGPLCQAENLQHYEEQRQILLAMHNQQLSDQVRQHQTQKIQLRDHLQTMDREILAKIQALKTADLQNQCQDMMQTCAEIRPRRTSGNGVNQSVNRSVIGTVNHRVAFPPQQSATILSGNQTSLTSPPLVKSPNSNYSIAAIMNAITPNHTSIQPTHHQVQPSHRITLPSKSLVTSSQTPTHSHALQLLAHAVVQPTSTNSLTVSTHYGILSDHKTVPPRATQAPSQSSLATIPGFQELVSTLSTCDQCKSLSAYQRVNQQCPRCEDLRQKHCNNKRQNIANFTNTAVQLVPNSQQQQQSQQYISSQQSSTHNSSANYTNVKVKHTSATYTGDNEPLSYHDQNYLQYQTAQNANSAGPISAQGQLPCQPQSSTVSYPDSYTTSMHLPHQHGSMDMQTQDNIARSVESRRGPTNMVLIEKTATSTSKTKVSATNELELSPVIPYANYRSQKQADKLKVECNEVLSAYETQRHLEPNCSQPAKSHVITITQTPMPNNRVINESAKLSDSVVISSSNMQIDSDKSNNIPQVLDAIKTNPGLSSEQTLSVASSSKATVTVDHLFRSHSQSELYDQKKDESALALRTLRSRSENEVFSSAGIDEGNQPVREQDKETSPADFGASKNGKKRKTAKTAAVPGWFGKGLNLKKKRKY